MLRALLVVIALATSSASTCKTEACCRRHPKACRKQQQAVSSAGESLSLKAAPSEKADAVSVAEELKNGTVVLNDGVRMPRLGIGTASGLRAEPALVAALKLGYRMIDTAIAYSCESAVAGAIAQSGVPRSELFVVTKSWPFADMKGKDRSASKPTKDGPALLREFEAHLAALRMGYVDLLLLHWPTARLQEHWEVLSSLRSRGLARAIGISNANAAHMAQLAGAAVQPAVVQAELGIASHRIASHSTAQHSIA